LRREERTQKKKEILRVIGLLINWGKKNRATFRGFSEKSHCRGLGSYKKKKLKDQSGESGHTLGEGERVLNTKFFVKKSKDRTISWRGKKPEPGGAVEEERKIEVERGRQSPNEGIR